jgi:hypothetical protein
MKAYIYYEEDLVAYVVTANSMEEAVEIMESLGAHFQDDSQIMSSPDLGPKTLKIARRVSHKEEDIEKDILRDKNPNLTVGEDGRLGYKQDILFGKP